MPIGSEWEVEQIRITGFFANPVDPVSVGIWPFMLQIEPSKTEINRAQGIRTELIQNDGRLFVAQMNAVRFDWIYRSADINNSAVVDSIGGIDVIENVVRTTLLPSLERIPEVQRLALALTGKQICTSVDDARSTLKNLVPFLPLGKNVRETEYAVNSPRSLDLGAQYIEVNRVSRWSIGEIVVREDFGGRAVIRDRNPILACEFEDNTEVSRGREIGRELHIKIVEYFLNDVIERSKRGYVDE